VPRRLLELEAVGRELVAAEEKRSQGWRRIHKLGLDFLAKGAKLKTNVAAWAKKKKSDKHRQMQAKVVKDVIDDIRRKIPKWTL